MSFLTIFSVCHVLHLCVVSSQHLTVFKLGMHIRSIQFWIRVLDFLGKNLVNKMDSVEWLFVLVVVLCVVLWRVFTCIY